jgi:thiamine transport system substrate-binding protein
MEGDAMSTVLHGARPTRRRGAAVALLVSVLVLVAAACGDDGPRELTILAHDSFTVDTELMARFEEEHDVTVTVIPGGDGIEVVSRAILNAGNPEADLLFGVDNLSYRRALDAGVFEPYEAERRADLPAELLDAVGGSLELTPIDFGFVDVNVDLAAGLGAAPASIEELADPRWRGALAVEDPATSSPGLQFLALTVALLGEGGWQEFWEALRANDVRVTDGWSSAYYTEFSRNGGARPLVVSYTSSPAAEVFFAGLDEPPTASLAAWPLLRQVEAAGVLAGAGEPELARAFIDFMLTDAFQEQIPGTMFVAPAIPGTPTPAWWRWAEIDVEPATLDASAEDIDRWVREWTRIMRR